MQTLDLPATNASAPQWDPRLTARGVRSLACAVLPGQSYWRLVKGQWLDTQEAKQFGPNHHILVDALDEQGQRVVGTSLIVTWPSGSDHITTKGNNGYPWAADYPMSPSLNEFSVVVVDARPSDRVWGLGMGKDGNAGEHTSTLLVFQRTTYVDYDPTIPDPPTPPVDPPLPPTLDPVLDALAQARHWLDVAAEIYSRQAAR